MTNGDLMEPSEELVTIWLNQNGFFTLNNWKVGGQEIDLLAWNPKTNKKQHYEIQVSVNPVGLFFGGAKITTAPPLSQRVKTYFESKFEGKNKRIATKVTEIFGTAKYEKVLVVGLLNETYDPYKRFRQEFRKHGVKVIDFKKIIKELNIKRTRYMDARRYIQLERCFR